MDTFDSLLKKSGEIGFATEILNFLVYVDGLPTVKLNEIVMFESGEQGRVFTISDTVVEVLMLSKATVKVGTRVTRTNRFMEIMVGDGLIGKILNPLGVTLDTN